MRNLNFRKTILTAFAVAFCAVFVSSDLVAQWNTSTNGKITTVDQVGIGVVSPVGKLNILNEDNTNVPALYVQQKETGNSTCNLSTEGYGLFVKSSHSNSKYLLRLSDGDNKNVMYARADGRVGIGTSYIPSDGRLNVFGKATITELGVGTYNIPEGYKLGVDGKIIAEEVKVQLSQNWPDYVFDEENYSPMSIEEKEAFTQENKHLPSFAPEAEMNETGIVIGENITNTVKELEEAYLYIYELNDLLKKQQAQMKEQQSQIEAVNIKLNELSE